MISIQTHNRQNLSVEQKEALSKLAPLSITISEWIEAKCRFLGKPGYMFPSLILADMLMESNFLSWQLSKEYIDGRYANNITKIKLDSSWTGKSIEYEGIKYKTYRDWLHFASDYSDILCFSSEYDFMLTQPLGKQIKALSSYKNDRKWSKAKLETLIDFYNLTEID